MRPRRPSASSAAQGRGTPPDLGMERPQVTLAHLEPSAGHALSRQVTLAHLEPSAGHALSRRGSECGRLATENGYFSGLTTLWIDDADIADVV
jgi:hypothetical protein